VGTDEYIVDIQNQLDLLGDSVFVSYFGAPLEDPSADLGSGFGCILGNYRVLKLDLLYPNLGSFGASPSACSAASMICTQRVNRRFQ
jgi:hypothetical protein